MFFWFLVALWLASVVFVVLYISALKMIIRQMRMGQFEIRPGSPDELKGIDLIRLEEVTRELESLGFQRLGDLVSRRFESTPQPPAPIADPFATQIFSPSAPEKLSVHSFSRVLMHPTHCCLGVIAWVIVQDTTGARPTVTTFSVSLLSGSESRENGWKYSTTDNAPKIVERKLIMLIRLPRDLWTRTPNVTSAQLVKNHLSRRQQIADVAGISWANSFSLEAQIAAEQTELERLRTFFGTMTPFKMWWGLSKIRRDSNAPEWLGELKNRIEPVSD